jgi:signal peptidase I
VVSGRQVVSLLLNVAIVFSVAIVVISVMNDLDIALPVQGISMQPAIHTGDLAIVFPVSVNSLHVGDVIVYRYCYGGDCMLIIHRVYTPPQGDPAYVLVKGDNNPTPDQNYTGPGPRQVNGTMLVGRVVLLVYGFGVFADTTVKYIFSAILVLLIILDYYSGSGKSRPERPRTGQGDSLQAATR